MPVQLHVRACLCQVVKATKIKDDLTCDVDAADELKKHSMSMGCQVRFVQAHLRTRFTVSVSRSNRLIVG